MRRQQLREDFVKKRMLDRLYHNLLYADKGVFKITYITNTFAIFEEVDRWTDGHMTHDT